MARTLSAVAQRVSGELSGADAPFAEVSTDTRGIARGDLFVALSGERFDGHDFLADAQAKGAAGAMVAHLEPVELAQIRVADTRRGLGQLGHAWRTGFAIPVIGVTGSNGKTTVKEMLAAILGVSRRVLATRGNFNNDIGVPLTLLRLKRGHEAAVIEMGANHPGEIAYLARLAAPQVGVVTNAAAAHLEGFGSLDGVVAAKGELFAQLAADGTAVINLDDPAADRWQAMSTAGRVLGFGLAAAAYSSVAGAVRTDQRGSNFTLRLGKDQIGIRLPMPGTHNVLNALAAAAAAHAIGATLDDIAAGLALCEGVGGRLQVVAGRRGTRLIDDSYNANPASVRAAVNYLAELPGRRWLVLGDMAELGPSAVALHEEVGAYAAQRDLDGLLGVGQLAAHAVRGFGPRGLAAADVAAAARMLEEHLGADVTLLIKGSRCMGLERLVAALAGEQAPC